MTETIYVVEHPTEALVTAEEARRRTDEVKADAESLWVKLLALYRDGVHLALGKSWSVYCATEFQMDRKAASRMLAAVKVFEQFHPGPRSNGEVSPIGDTGPTTESVARELVPVLREDPSKVRETWNRVIEEHGSEPTAKQVRETVQQINGTPPVVAPSWVVRMEHLADELRRVARARGQEREELCEALQHLIADVQLDVERIIAGDLP